MKIVFDKKNEIYLIIGTSTFFLSLIVLLLNLIYFKNSAILWISVAILIVSAILIIATLIKDRYKEKQRNNRRKAQ